MIGFVLWISVISLISSIIAGLIVPEIQETLQLATFGLVGIIMACISKLERQEQRKNYERQWAGGPNESRDTQVR